MTAGAVILAFAAGAGLLYGVLRPEEQALVAPVAGLAPAAPLAYQPSGPDLTLPAMYPEPLVIHPAPHTASPVTLHIGPSPDYVILGTLQEGAPLNLVGRDDTGDWIAVVFPPNSTFVGWLPASDVEGVRDLEKLPVEPVGFLP